MKTQLATLLLAAALPLAAHASQPQSAPLVIDCAHPAMPSQLEVARFTGVDNFSQAYAIRTSLMQQAAKQCHRGALRVALVIPSADAKQDSINRLAAAKSATP